MKVAIIVLSALAGATSAYAEDDAFAHAVFKCWNIPAGIEKTDKFVMSVEIDHDGELVDITAKEYKEGGAAKVMGMSLQRAIMRCAPYNFPAGVYTITIDHRKPTGKSLNPFK